MRDPADFIRANLPLAAVPACPDIRLHLATPASGLSRLLGDEAASPYWAFCWGGGLALARHLRDHPGCMRGRRVLDFGAGSGLVAIAAAKAGARSVIAAEIDPRGAVAISLNAAANGVVLDIVATDLVDVALPAVDIVLAGDTFYDAALGLRVTGYLDRCLEAGIEVLVGDPGRAPLPLPRLRELARYRVGDFGDGAMSAAVYAFERNEARGKHSP
jgi:predicted nicotinamide N-methyase